jgi:adenine-specific DNA methylase
VPVEGTPHNRCLEFIKHLVRWENSNNPDYIEPARKLIAAAHKFLHPDADGDTLRVLDPFAGGGSIPLEALRLGCEAYAIDRNPVAHLIELCTLVYPQKYGQPDSRPVPDYIKRLIAHNRAKKQAHGETTLFDTQEKEVSVGNDKTIPDVEITEEEYRENPLAADVKYWGHWVLEKARQELGQFYPPDPDSSIPIAYLWVRIVMCPNPQCGAKIPLYRQLWLSKRGSERLALRPVLDTSTRACDFEVVAGNEIDFDPLQGTMSQGRVSCPFCHTTADSKYLQEECRSGRMSQQLMAVITACPKERGRGYRVGNASDRQMFEKAMRAMESLQNIFGKNILPQEEISKQQPRIVFVTLYGLSKWCDIFSARQALALSTFVCQVYQAIQII